MLRRCRFDEYFFDVITLVLSFILLGATFSPDFPATCPYVTAVGATQIQTDATVYDKEMACETVIYSGGGFSNVFSMPTWQASAVGTYLKDYPPPYTSAQYNNTGNVC